MALSDTRSTDDLRVKLKHPQTLTALLMHSNHLKNPDDPTTDLNKRNSFAIENIKNVDALIVMTEKQKNDIVNRYGYEDKIHFIPNYYDVSSSKIKRLKSIFSNITQNNSQRDMSKAIVIARFSGIKNIDHTIKAFKNVVKEVPEATLEIWGSGDKK